MLASIKLYLLIQEYSWVGELLKHEPSIVIEIDLLMLVWIEMVKETDMDLDFLFVDNLNQLEFSQFSFLLLPES